MTNGQMNIASMPTAMPFIAREAPAAAAVTTEGTPHAGFAKLLGERQLSAEKNTPAEPEQPEQEQAEKSGDPVFSDVASQVALAAYIQPVIPATDNKQIPLPVDMQQNATMATEPSAVITESAVTAAALLPDDMLQNVALAPAPVDAQKQQQPEITRTAVGDLLTAKTESASAVPTTVVAGSLTSSPALPVAVGPETQKPEPLLSTASAAGTTVAAGKASTETLTIRQRLNSERQMEKALDVSTAKETALTRHMETSGTESAVDSETSSNFDGQEQPDGAFDNSATSQNMPGQLVVEQQKVSAAATKPAPLEPLRQDIPAQVMPQVKERLDQHELKAGKEQITLTLSPDTLGEIKMNLNLQGGKLSLEIVTENRAVRDAIMQHADTLKESLARQNITMESFDVTTGGKGSGNQGQNQNAWRELMQQQQQQQQQQQYWTAPRGYGVVQAELPSGPAVQQQRRQGQSMLDIHY
ncbi:MAG TPA: hypothetical protein HPP97_08830 [Desulfuromonadales bacterium]|nr:hypothetical protein [Desulfuromonadales bacterium]